MRIDGAIAGKESGSRPGLSTSSGDSGRIGLLAILSAYGLAMVLLLVAARMLGGGDYVGPDNDDVMRLIEIRDLLGGQGWYDMTQYRLGLDGGTLMHWSRFIDLPMAGLIRFFGLFAADEMAEALALAVWPLSLSFVLVVLMGLAGYRAGGRVTMHIAAGMAIFYVYGMGRFMPGSADHHNAQLTLATLLVAMLLDPRHRLVSFGFAGFAAAMEIAVGAESVPFVAAACAVVACLWGWYGEDRRRAVVAFSLSLLFFVTAAFFLTVPPHLYGMVTCDNLSLGFYSLTSVGAFLLFTAATLASRFNRLARFGVLVLVGAAVLMAAKIIAPRCLGNPLADLDPMLTELWLNKVIEAHSITAQWAEAPTSVGGFYAVGALGLVVCIFRLARREMQEQHFVLLVLLAVSLAVASMQVRGAMFSNLLAIIPMAVLVSDLRRWQQESPASPLRSLAYLSAGLFSLPLVWSVAGLALDKGWKAVAAQLDAPKITGPASCASKAALLPLSTEPRGVVMAPSDLGAQILRYTPHRVLSAPYHRNQGGMLTELNTGLAMPDEAIAFLRGAKVDYVLFCPGEIQTRDLAARKPEGFYGSLMAGRVPSYLVAIKDDPADALKIYRVVR